MVAKSDGRPAVRVESADKTQEFVSRRCLAVAYNSDFDSFIVRRGAVVDGAYEDEGDGRTISK